MHTEQHEPCITLVCDLIYFSTKARPQVFYSFHTVMPLMFHRTPRLRFDPVPVGGNSGRTRMAELTTSITIQEPQRGKDHSLYPRGESRIMLPLRMISHLAHLRLFQWNLKLFPPTIWALRDVKAQ